VCVGWGWALVCGVDVTYPTGGLGVNIIDFTLSRLDMGGDAGVAFCDLNQDPDLFKGRHKWRMPATSSTKQCTGARHVIRCIVYRCSPYHPPHDVPGFAASSTHMIHDRFLS